MRFSGLALASCAAMVLVAADDAWAGRGGRGSASGGSGRASHSGSGHHHHHSGGSRVFIGGTFWGWPAYYYPAPYYYYPYPAQYYNYPPPPPVYIQQEPQPVVPESQLYWYYCPGSKAYYPYVKDCSSGWQRVMPYPMQEPTG